MHIKTKQAEIIKAAGELLTEGGLLELTTKNLAKKMNFTEAAIYRHFSGKDEIIITMLQYLAELTDEQLTAALSKKTSAKEQLKTVFDVHFEFFNENRHFLAAIFSDGLWENNPDIKKEVENVMAVRVKHLINIFNAGIKNKELRDDIPAEHFVHIVMGAIRLHILKWRMSNFSFDLQLSGKKLYSSIIKLFNIL